MITLNVTDVDLEFEHSLVSLSKWEEHYEKPFYNPNKQESRPVEEWDKYFEFMFIGPKEYSHLVLILTDEDKIRLVQYIQKKSTATTINQIQKQSGPKENPTSELIYYWLVAFRIPFRPTETWHLNRLLTLVEVCSAKQAPPPKKGRRDQAKLAQSMREINEQRRRELGTSG